VKIVVKAKVKAKIEKVEKIDNFHFVVAVKEPPEKGKANRAITKKLAKYFRVSLSDVILVSGTSSKNKSFAIPCAIICVSKIKSSLFSSNLTVSRYFRE